MEIVGAIIVAIISVGVILNPAVDHSAADEEMKRKLLKWHIWGPPKE